MLRKSYPSIQKQDSLKSHVVCGPLRLVITEAMNHVQLLVLRPHNYGSSALVLSE
jgi:hypothetical protein